MSRPRLVELEPSKPRRWLRLVPAVVGAALAATCPYWPPQARIACEVAAKVSEVLTHAIP